jgi:predicted molibdopterin-dependent oxidoreductase YjgC
MSQSTRVQKGGVGMSRRYRRLSQPLIREDGGRNGFRPVAWDEALDRAVAGLRRVVDRHGPSAFGLFSCSKSTNETNFIAQKFARSVIGSNNIDSCNRT